MLLACEACETRANSRQEKKEQNKKKFSRSAGKTFIARPVNFTHRQQTQQARHFVLRESRKGQKFKLNENITCSTAPFAKSQSATCAALPPVRKPRGSGPSHRETQMLSSAQASRRWRQVQLTRPMPPTPRYPGGAHGHYIIVEAG